MDVREMKAGRELDALVAEKVMGLKLGSQIWEDDNGKIYYETARNYSTDISTAWKVFTHFGFQGSVSFSGGEWFCEIMTGFNDMGYGVYFKGEGFTAPEAICKAALLAMEDKK